VSRRPPRIERRMKRFARQHLNDWQAGRIEGYHIGYPLGWEAGYQEAWEDTRRWTEELGHFPKWVHFVGAGKLAGVDFEIGNRED
jgi:flagellar biosynthesis/type III secretory pathway protein FliH